MLIKACAAGSVLLSGIVSSSLVFDPVNLHKASRLQLDASTTHAGHIFEQPTVNGYRLSSCASKSGDCRGEAAQTYCLERGFSDMEGYTLSGIVDFDTKTIATGEVCMGREGQCSAYEEISCAPAGHYAKLSEPVSASAAIMTSYW